MYFGTRYIQPKVEENLAECSFNPNYEQDFYDEFYRIHWMAESEIDFNLQLNSLLEGYDVDIHRKAPWEPEEKGPTLMERVKQMVDSVVKWIKESFIRLSKYATELYKKIRDNTLRDQALQKLFKNFKYDDLMKAKEKGWPGIPEYLNSPAKAENDPMKSEVFDTYVTYCRDAKWDNFTTKIIGEDKLAVKLKDMIANQTLENAKAKYEEIMADIKEYKKHYELNRGKYIYLQSGIPATRLVFATSEDEKSKIKDGYYYPRAEKFAILQDIVYNSQKQLGDMRKSFEDNFLKIYNDNIKIDKSELKAVKSEKDTSENQGAQISAYYLKARLAISTFRLGVAKNIMSELIKTINDTFRYAFVVFTYILSSVKGYLLGSTIKDKVSGKKGEKEPDVEPQAASYIDYGAQFVIECGLLN